MNLKNLVHLLAIALIIFGCSSNSNDDLTPDPDPDPDPDPNPSAVTYDGDIKSLMSSSCTGCHGSPTSNGAPMSLTTYTQVKNNINGIISRTNSNSNPMPPGGLMASGNRNLLQQWKDDGLLEN